MTLSGSMFGAATAKEATLEAHDVHEGHDHSHGERCGHTAVMHASHVDYVVDGHLHHAHEGHCDDHGALQLA